jgi:hypothetical protein
MVLETDEPLTTLTLELSTVSAAAHVTLGVVSMVGHPVDASHQWLVASITLPIAVGLSP